MKKILVTGGCGFIGSGFIEYQMQEYDVKIINVDRISIGGDKQNISAATAADDRYKFYQIDITDPIDVECVFEENKNIDAVVNFAAETHVDRSLTDRVGFVNSNVLGVQTLLDAIIKYNIPKLLHISTDEVYGSVYRTNVEFTEDDHLNPTNPYSASKAAAEMMIKAAIHSFGVNAIITRSCNNYGPRQYHEKLIPKVLKAIRDEKPITVYNDGQMVREWMHVLDNCIGIDKALQCGWSGEVYNLGTTERVTVLNVIKHIHDILDKEMKIEFTKDRANDDIQYSIDSSKAKSHLNWKPQISFENGLRSTIEWYVKRFK